MVFNIFTWVFEESYAIDSQSQRMVNVERLASISRVTSFDDK